MQKKFEVTDLSALPEILEFIELSLKELKVDSKEIIRSELMCEEAIVKLIGHGDFSKRKFITVKVKNFLGSVSIDLRVPGNEFDFYIDAGIPFSKLENDEDATDAIRNLLLHSFINRIKYKHAGNFNIIKINVLHSPYLELYKISAVIILAIIAGFVLKNFMPAEFSQTFNEYFFEPVHLIFLNGLKMCSVPIMFFAIILSLAQSENFYGIKRIAGKLFFCFFVHMVIALLIGFGLVYFFDIGKGLHLSALSIPSEQVQNFSFSLKDTFIGMIPDNFIKPFFEGNMMHLMILAILIGIAANISGSKIIISVFDEINKIFIHITEIFLLLVPLLVFFSITSIFITTGTETLLLVFGIVLTSLTANALIFFTYYLMIALFTRLKPSITFKKAVPLIMTAFTTCSSSASIPECMKTAKNLGVSEKISSFSVPFGTIFCKNTLCLFLFLLTLITANMYGIEMTFSTILLTGFYSSVFPILVPGIPGVTIIALSSIWGLIGFPLDNIAIAVAVEPFTDMGDTLTIVLAILTSTLLVAKSENQLDIEKYKS